MLQNCDNWPHFRDNLAILDALFPFKCSALLYNLGLNLVSCPILFNCNEEIMTDSHDDHESPIKTPKQLIVAVLAGLFVPIIIIVLLIQFVANGKKDNAGSTAQTPEAIVARISPVADEGYTFKDASAPKVLQSGEAVYKMACAACHDSGAAGSPKFADAAGWAPRIAQGYDKVVANAIGGLRAMPAKGGNPDLDDVEVARAVVHMANAGGAKFKEPEVKAPAADAPAK
jgi:cytochrome c5